MIIIIISASIIWLACTYIGFKIIKKDIIKQGLEWTNGYMLIALFLSLIAWYGYFIIFIIEGIKLPKWLDKPSKF